MNCNTKRIYFDNAATTKEYDEVIKYVSDINENIYGNPSSLHRMGIEAENLTKVSRNFISESIGVNPDEIFFTSGGTEANNLAIFGFLSANPRKGKHIITSKIEHPSVLEVFKSLALSGYQVDYVDVDKEGIVNIDLLNEMVREDTALISIMYVNNETGAIQPIERIAESKRNAVLHVDAVQAYGKHRFFPKKQGIDLMSISSHKIHGPKGVGALYVNKKNKLKASILGGGQEKALRSGTENVAGIAGFGLAGKLAYKNLDENFIKINNLKNQLLKGIIDDIGDIRVNSCECSSPYILNISFHDVRGEVLLHYLESQNIFVSTGSACSSKQNKKNHVLAAALLSKEEIDGAIRFSFSEFNQEQDVLDTLNALKEIVPKIRKNVRRK